jgi:hypothetical protein
MPYGNVRSQWAIYLILAYRIDIALSQDHQGL